MRSLILSAAAIVIAGGLSTAGAQGLNTVGQSPPAPNSAQGAPQPANSLPAGSATGATLAPGASLGGSAAAAPSSGVNSLHPLRQPRRAATHRPTPRRPAHRATRPASSS